jgi:ABC-type sugar transport system substrate-binding protein
MKNPQLRGVVVALAVLLALSACGGGAGSEGGGEAGKQQPVIGVSLDQLFPGRQAEMEGVRAAAKEAGAQLKVSVADGDAQQQNSQIQSFVGQQVDALMVVAVDQAAIGTAIQSAADAGIPVVTFDRALPNNKNVAFHAGLDSFADGKSCGEYIARQNDGKPRKVLELLGALNDQNAIDRRDGFEEGLKGQDNLKFIKAPTDWDADKALSATENALQANPDIWAIVIPSDFMMGSVETALKNADRLAKVGEKGHVISCAIDGSKPGYEATVAGTNDALVALPLAQLGGSAFKAAETLAKGGKVEKASESFPGTLYTYKNVKQNADKIWGAQASK